MPTTVARSIAAPASCSVFGKALADVLRDRRLVMYERPRSPFTTLADVVAEPRGQRIVEVELRAQARDRRAVGALADHRLHRIAGRDVEQQEGDDEHAEQRRDGEQQPPKDERASLARSSVGCRCVTSVQRWPLKITGGTKSLIQGCTAYSSL